MMRIQTKCSFIDHTQHLKLLMTAFPREDLWTSSVRNSSLISHQDLSHFETSKEAWGISPDQWPVPRRTGYCSRHKPTVLTLTMSYRFLPRNQIDFVPEKTFSSLKNLGEL